MKRKWQSVDGFLLAGLVLIVVGVGWEYQRKVAPRTEVELVSNRENEKKVVLGDKVKVLVVDVAGAVEDPGVYEFFDGDRLREAMVMAGGMSVEADREWVEKNLNLASELRDGMKIYIPRKGEEIAEGTGGGQKELGVVGQTGKVNINGAGEKELESLPGIGPAFASRIVEYREKNGGFLDVEEVKLVTGIGDKLFEKIKDLIEI